MAAVVIFIGPSGIGKSFAASMLINSFPDRFARAKVYTTRRKRSSEDRPGDRIFVSQEQFDHMAQNNDFGLVEHFAGNWYGYRKADLEPADRHLIANAPPAWLPQLLHHSHVVVIGLQAPPDYWVLLDARMEARGDSLQSRNIRKTHIEKDIQDLEKLRPLVNRNGKIFEIKDDNTVPDKVIPWIIKTLGIK